MIQVYIIYLAKLSTETKILAKMSMAKLSWHLRVYTKKYRHLSRTMLFKNRWVMGMTAVKSRRNKQRARAVVIARLTGKCKTCSNI